MFMLKKCHIKNLDLGRHIFLSILPCLDPHVTCEKHKNIYLATMLAYFIKAYYECYETLKNGNLHTCTLSWLNN
jgi:hypothetical protein